MDDEKRRPVYHGCGAVVFSVPAHVRQGDKIEAAHILFPDGRRPKPTDPVEGCPRCGMSVLWGAMLEKRDATA